MEEIKGEDYTVQYDSEQVRVDFQGEMALGGPAEYQPITDLLNDIADSAPAQMTLNLRELEFLNSSGISMLSKFVLSLRKKQDIDLVVLGSSDMPWQSKSLQNLKKLLPTLTLEVD